MKPAEKIPSSTAPRQIVPPPLSQHLREFASRPHSWAVLARNLIPVAGVYAFGSIAISHFWKAFRTGYDEMPDISSSNGCAGTFICSCCAQSRCS